MSEINLKPRSEHVGREFTAPHEDLYRAMYRFRDDLRRAEREYREEVVAIREKLGVPAVYTETVDVHRYSLAVQVFAAATVEAAISLYAVVVFGGENHDEHFRWAPADKRLRKIFTHAGLDVNEDAEVLGLVREIMDARHRIVHPFSVEYLGSEQATIEVPNRPGPDESADAAQVATRRVDRFFALMHEIDPENGHFLAVF